MQQSVIDKISKVFSIFENYGKTIVPDALITVHRKDGLKGIWWYRIHDGKMEYSEKARSHFDDVFDLADPESRQLARGRIGMYKNKPFVLIYTHDFHNEHVPGTVLVDIITKLENLSGVELDIVVDEEGRNLL